MSTLEGTTLGGRYRLEARIGTGGMSTVYRALDETLQRRVAIKLMNREVASDSDQLERFRREARAVAQLSHPNIVGVIDAGDDQDPTRARPYIVFEYVEGETLKDRIRREGRLPIPEAVAYSIEIARALGAAHARHIVHRDVKPQNVLIDHEGSAKVTDFGIARTLEEEGLTVDGRVLGTTDYVSPEQALGQRVTGQSDLYSLGIALYEMLTGEVPFKGENQVAVAMKHVREQLPDVRRARPEVSAALAAVLEGATAKRVEDRYANDGELIADLEDVLALETSRAGAATGEVTSVLRTLPASKRRRVPWLVRHRRAAAVLALVALLAAGGVAVWLATRAHPGTGKPPAHPSAGLHRVYPCNGCARGFNPLGSPPDEAPGAGQAIDGDSTTAWTTQHYYSSLLSLKGPHCAACSAATPAGTGLYVYTASAVVVRQLRIATDTPGFTASIYARVDPPPMKWPDAGWVRVAPSASIAASDTIGLATDGRSFRYFLVWITTLPPSTDHVDLNEVTLYG